MPGIVEAHGEGNQDGMELRSDVSGGGFPGRHLGPPPHIGAYGQAAHDALVSRWTDLNFARFASNVPVTLGVIGMKKSIAPLGLFLFIALAGKSWAQPVLSIDFNKRGTDPATNTMAGFSSFLIDSVGSANAIQTAPTVRTFGAITVTLAGAGATTGYDDRLRATPLNSGAFTQGLLLRDFVFSRDVGNGGLDITIDGLTANQFYKATIWSFDTSSGGRRVSDWSANDNVVINDYTFDGRVLPTNDLQYRFTFVVGASDSGEVLIQGRRDSTSVDTANAPSFGVFLNALQLEPTDPRPSLVTQPVGATRSLGDRVTFTVTVDGFPPFNYQWFKGGVPIDGATSSSLTLANLTVADSADYTVEVSNSIDHVLSNPATLTVRRPMCGKAWRRIGHWTTC